MMECVSAHVRGRRPRALPAAHGALPRGQRRLDRARWLERLDHHYEVFRWDVPWLQMKPSEYFRRQCYISFDPDEIDARLHRAPPARRRRPHHLGERLPAPRREVPRRRRRARVKRPKSSNAAEQARIMGLNSAELYHLPAP